MKQDGKESGVSYETVFRSVDRLLIDGLLYNHYPRAHTIALLGLVTREINAKSSKLFLSSMGPKRTITVVLVTNLHRAFRGQIWFINIL